MNNWNVLIKAKYNDGDWNIHPFLNFKITIDEQVTLEETITIERPVEQFIEKLIGLINNSANNADLVNLTNSDVNSLTPVLIRVCNNENGRMGHKFKLNKMEIVA